MVILPHQCKNKINRLTISLVKTIRLNLPIFSYRETKQITKTSLPRLQHSNNKHILGKLRRTSRLRIQTVDGKVNKVKTEKIGR